MSPYNSFRTYVFQDWHANSNSAKSRFVLSLFRFIQFLNNHAGVIGRTFAVPFSILYTIIVQWLLGIEIPISAIVGKGLQLYHGVGLVVHPASVIGEGCVLRHCITIGSKDNNGSGYQTAPVLGDRVDVGCNSVIIGHVFVGNNAIIGAGSVVVHDVPENSVVCGNPARVIRTRKNETSDK